MGLWCEYAGVCASGFLLMEAGTKLLGWWSRVCPSRARDMAEVLQCRCDTMAAQWANLVEARKASSGEKPSENAV